jgi:hypothetical protein
VAGAAFIGQKLAAHRSAIPLLILAAALCAAWSSQSRAQPPPPEWQYCNRHPYACIDPYGLDRFQANAHNYCLSGCDASYSTCMMSYLSSPSPEGYCRQIQAACAWRCP